MDIQYRMLSPEDSFLYRSVRLESLKLHPECFGSGYEKQAALPQLYFERLIIEGNKQNIMLGAFDCERLVGLCGVTFQESDSAEIIQMYVHADYRGNGLGANLLVLAKKHAVETLQVSTLTLSVYEDNAAAMNTYRYSGFEVMGTCAETGEVNMLFPCG